MKAVYFTQSMQHSMTQNIYFAYDLRTVSFMVIYIVMFASNAFRIST